MSVFCTIFQKVTTTLQEHLFWIIKNCVGKGEVRRIACVLAIRHFHCSRALQAVFTMEMWKASRAGLSPWYSAMESGNQVVNKVEGASILPFVEVKGCIEEQSQKTCFSNALFYCVVTEEILEMCVIWANTTTFSLSIRTVWIPWWELERNLKAKEYCTLHMQITHPHVLYSDSSQQSTDTFHPAICGKCV